MAAEFTSLESSLEKHLPPKELEEVKRILYGKPVRLVICFNQDDFQGSTSVSWVRCTMGHLPRTDGDVYDQSAHNLYHEFAKIDRNCLRFQTFLPSDSSLALPEKILKFWTL